MPEASINVGCEERVLLHANVLDNNLQEKQQQVSITLTRVGRKEEKRRRIKIMRTGTTRLVKLKKKRKEKGFAKTSKSNNGFNC